MQKFATRFVALNLEPILLPEEASLEDAAVDMAVDGDEKDTNKKVETEVQRSVCDRLLNPNGFSYLMRARFLSPLTKAI